MKHIILPLISLCWIQAASATESLGLQAAVEQALQYAPALQAEQAARDAAQENIALGKAVLRPYVAVSGSFKQEKQHFTYDQPLSFLRTNISNRKIFYGIQLVQPLFDLSKWALYQQGQLTATSADLKLAVQRQQTTLQAASAWLDVMRSQAALHAATKNEQAMQSLAKKMDLAFKIGLSSINESLAAVSRFDLAKAARIRAANAVLQAKATLDSLLGQAVNVDVQIPQNFRPLSLQPNNLEGWKTIAENQSLSIQLARERVEIFDNQYTQALGNAMPKVQLIAGWNKNQASDGSFGGSSVKTSVIGIELNAPLYAGGALSAKRREATKHKVQAEYQIAEAKRSTRLSIQQTWLALQSGLAELSALKHAKVSAKEALKASQVGLEVGLRTLNDVMDSQQRLASTEQSYADALARYAMSWLQLHTIAGQLKSDDLKALDHLLK
ncbi:MAG: TolC family outer membrane protein [Zetaproteobacteria bacterium]|nr:TolC family outer membrane protein [Zetaproteobacteria bacterium]